MTVKEYLAQYRTLDAYINAKLEQVEHLRTLVTRTNAGRTTGGFNPMPYDKVGEITAKIVDLENEINSEIDKLIDLQAEIKGYTALIPNAKVRLVIDLHYINGRSFKEIARSESRDIRTIFRWHETGLNYLEKSIKNFENVIQCH